MTKRPGSSTGRCLVVIGALVAAMVSIGPSSVARAILLPEDVAGVRLAPLQASWSIPSGGPFKRAGHLADQRASAYFSNASVGRTIAAPRDRSPGKAVQVVWLATLLVSICSFIMLVGRQLPEGVAVGRVRSRRRA